MNEKTLKRLAYATSPFLTIAVVAGMAAAAPPGSDTTETQHRRPELTQEQKDILDQARELGESGDKEGAKALLESAGLPGFPGMMHRGGFQKGDRPRAEEMQAQHEAVSAALESGDYDAFVAATADAPFADKVTPDFFAKFQEAHEHFEAGRAIMESLGVERPGRPPVQK